MIKIIENTNRDATDRRCWENSVNYWVREGYKVINTFIEKNKIVAVLDNGKDR